MNKFMIGFITAGVMAAGITGYAGGADTAYAAPAGKTGKVCESSLEAVGTSIDIIKHQEDAQGTVSTTQNTGRPQTAASGGNTQGTVAAGNTSSQTASGNHQTTQTAASGQSAGQTTQSTSQNTGQSQTNGNIYFVENTTEAVWVEPVYEKVWVVDREAQTVELPVYENVYKDVCNGCGADITADPTAHFKSKINAGILSCGGFHLEVEQVQVDTQTIYEPEEGHWEEVLVKDGYWEYR